MKLMKIITGRQTWVFDNLQGFDVMTSVDWLDEDYTLAQVDSGTYPGERNNPSTKYKRLDHLDDGSRGAPLAFDRNEHVENDHAYQRRLLQVDIPMNTNFMARVGAHQDAGEIPSD